MFPADAITSFVRGFLETKQKQKRIEFPGVAVDYSKWTCSYCDSINTTELNCRNCGATESKGLRNFEGLPFKKTTFLYKKEDK